MSIPSLWLICFLYALLCHRELRLTRWGLWCSTVLSSSWLESASGSFTPLCHLLCVISSLCTNLDLCSQARLDMLKCSLSFTITLPVMRKGFLISLLHNYADMKTDQELDVVIWLLWVNAYCLSDILLLFAQHFGETFSFMPFFR